MADELQHGRNCDALAHPVDGDCTCGLIYRKEIAACIDLIPENLRVQVCEGGGPENLAASLAVSIAKLAAHAKEQGKYACEMFDETKKAHIREYDANRKVAELGEQLEHDRTLVADCVTLVHQAILRYGWLTEGRGPYEWDDDRWREEFSAAAKTFSDAIEPMRKVAADWSGCPKGGENIANARINLKVMMADLQRELASWHTWGIVEIAIRNPNVESYMNEWESRATKAERANEVKDAIINKLLAGRAVDHIDGNINNNDIDNLRFVQISDNRKTKRRG